MDYIALLNACKTPAWCLVAVLQFSKCWCFVISTWSPKHMINKTAYYEIYMIFYLLNFKKAMLLQNFFSGLVSTYNSPSIQYSNLNEKMRFEKLKCQHFCELEGVLHLWIFLFLSVIDWLFLCSGLFKGHFTLLVEAAAWPLGLFKFDQENMFIISIFLFLLQWTGGSLLHSSHCDWWSQRSKHREWFRELMVTHLTFFHLKIFLYPYMLVLLG
jgi:hypothetical protein